MKALACLHQQVSVMLATTVLVARLSHNPRRTYVILATTVPLVAQYRCFARWGTISHLPVAKPVWLAQKGNTLTSLVAMRFQTALSVLSASTSQHLVVEQLLIASTAQRASTWM